MSNKLKFNEIISSYDGSYGFKLEETNLSKLLNSRRSFELLIHNPEIGISYILNKKEEPGMMVLEGLDTLRDFTKGCYHAKEEDKMRSYFRDIGQLGIVSFMEDSELLPGEFHVIRGKNYSETMVIGVAEPRYSWNNLIGFESKYIPLR